MMNQIYLEYKKDIGYNEKEIWTKSISLRSILEPYSTSENLRFLKIVLSHQFIPLIFLAPHFSKILLSFNGVKIAG